MRLGLVGQNSMKVLSKVVGIVQIPAFQHHFLQFLTAVCLASPASASILQKMSVSDMTHEAKEVQIGEVVSTWTSPDPDQKMFYTFVKLKVEKTLKGQASQEILLRQAGGSYRDPNTGTMTHQKVFGMETFQKGERGLFFITHANDGAPTVMFQGKQQIVKDGKTGLEDVVHERSPDVEFASRQKLSEEHERSLYAVYDKRPLNDMVLEIQKAVEMEKGESTKRK
jgi:hypothetical protein